MTVTAASAVLLAAALDRVVGEPPTRLHPVAWFGRLVAPFDGRWRHPRLVGVAVALWLPSTAALLGATAVWLGGQAHPVVGGLLAGLVLFSTTSLRMLTDAARNVSDRSATDLGTARQTLRTLAGRNASELSAPEVRSAVVESAAENLADGLVAPLLAFALLAPLSLPIAAGAAAWVKAVNTLDSMLGYREKPVGWASARLDDAVMWFPARLSALLLALVAGDPGAVVRARADARTTASPNSGWPMATLAAVLGVRLIKPGHYRLDGGPALPDVAEAERGVRLVGRAGLLAFLLAGVLAWS